MGAMQLKWGAYQWEANAVGVTSSVNAEINEGGQPYQLHYSLDVDGWIDGTSQDDLTTKSFALINALAVPYRDLILYQNNGNESALLLRNRGSISGVVCTRGPNFDDAKGAEYVLYRHFTATFEATYPLAGTAAYLLSYTETIATWGGGAVYDVADAVRGPAQRQKVKENTGYRATQIGSSSGYQKYPAPPNPLWPSLLVATPKVQRIVPKREGNSYTRYALSWEYEYASEKALPNPIPTLWRV